MTPQEKQALLDLMNQKYTAAANMTLIPKGVVAGDKETPRQHDHSVEETAAWRQANMLLAQDGEKLQWDEATDTFSIRKKQDNDDDQR